MTRWYHPRDGHPRQCTETAACPSAPNANPLGRCRNIIASVLFAAGERRCPTHGGARLKVRTPEAAAALIRAKRR